MAHMHCMLNTAVYKHTRNTQYLLLLHCNNGFTKALHCYVIRTLPVVFGRISVLVPLYSPINIHYRTAGVSGGRWQPVSPYHFSIVFPPMLRSYFGCVSSLGVWTQEPRVVHGPTGVWGKDDRPGVSVFDI